MHENGELSGCVCGVHEDSVSTGLLCTTVRAQRERALVHTRARAARAPGERASVWARRRSARGAARGLRAVVCARGRCVFARGRCLHEDGVCTRAVFTRRRRVPPIPPPNQSGRARRREPKVPHLSPKCALVRGAPAAPPPFWGTTVRFWGHSAALSIIPPPPPPPFWGTSGDFWGRGAAPGIPIIPSPLGGTLWDPHHPISIGVPILGSWCTVWAPHRPTAIMGPHFGI